ncbi:hypothetical protein [Sphingomicrobium aestuariivivum]|uniref:hypothetical protein n=1 Tax=Sphingomicrobium aestuariivivum TaxID=1582356 RepID=UPI001FD6503B|nr:hypothetical protein [Sphingomicrobium aestuariivivum]MCJ8191512.1 hypothetical protein [Sphingomicrobium aestuariivivum]
MLNIVSILIGIISIPLLIIGQIPFLGWTNILWLMVPVIGVVLGALSSSNHGRNFNAVIVVLMLARLVLLGGI